jgi:DNA-binding GntR family transcriptional regulator
MMARQLKESVLRFTAYKAIKDKIIYLDLKPGEKILESEIAESLSVSRTPVREALLMLENEKLVECNGSMGFIVRKFSAREIDEYFAVRKVIEEFVMSLVLQRITEPELKTLRENIQEAERHVEAGDIRNIIRYESEFHELLYRAAKSEVLFETISGLTDKFRWLRAIALNARGGARQSITQHKKILTAIEKKDFKKLRALVRTHLTDAQKKLSGAQSLLFWGSIKNAH